jgi:hypothetical protein
MVDLKQRDDAIIHGDTNIFRSPTKPALAAAVNFIGCAGGTCADFVSAIRPRQAERQFRP